MGLKANQINARNEVQNTWGSAKTGLRIGFWGTVASAQKFRAKVVDQSGIGMLMELPKSIALQSVGHQIGVRSLYTWFDNYTQAKSLEFAVGGVCRVEMLSIPFRPKSFPRSGWTLRAFGERELTRLAYPAGDVSGAVLQSLQPCKIEYRVPSTVLLEDKIKVSYWDGENWARDHITDVNFDPLNRRISFYSLRLAPFAITQPKGLDLPLVYWILRPNSAEQVEMQVKTQRFELLIRVSEKGVSLMGPALPELEHVSFEVDSGETTISTSNGTTNNGLGYGSGNGNGNGKKGGATRGGDGTTSSGTDCIEWRRGWRGDTSAAVVSRACQFVTSSPEVRY